MSWPGESSSASGLYVFSSDGSPYSLFGNENEILLFNGNEPVLLPQLALTGVAPDYGNMTGTPEFIPFDSGVGVPGHGEGRLFYDPNEHAFAYYNDEQDVTLQIGQESYIRVYNETGATITNGQLVYSSGADASEGRPAVGLASSASSDTAPVIGWATHDIENNTYGYVTHLGLVNNIGLEGVLPGSTLYLSSTPGVFSTGTPPDGEIEVIVGYCIQSGAAGRALSSIRAGLNLAIGDASQVVVDAQKASAGTISPGEVVYIAGYDVGQGVMTTELANANSVTTMPAFGIARDTITNTTTGKIIVNGKISNQDTSLFTAGDDLYVDEADGAITAIKPQGTALVQKIGICVRAHASLGIIEVFGAGRSNDLPNLAEGNIWVGDSNGVPIAISSGTADQILRISGTVGWGNPPINALGDVDTVSTPPSASDALVYDIVTTNWVPSGIATGGGGVTGPGSSTDNAIVRWDGAGGDTVQDSTPVVTDSGNIQSQRLVLFPQEVDNGNSGAGTFNINWQQGQKQVLTLTGAPTLTFTNPPGVCNLILRLEQDGTGSRTINTWPTGLRWPGGTEPTLTGTANGSDIMSFYFNGLYYYAIASFDFAA